MTAPASQNLPALRSRRSQRSGDLLTSSRSASSSRCVFFATRFFLKPSNLPTKRLQEYTTTLETTCHPSIARTVIFMLDTIDDRAASGRVPVGQRGAAL